MKFCAVDNAARQFSYWLIKIIVIQLIAILFATENCQGTVYILIAGQSEFQREALLSFSKIWHLNVQSRWCLCAQFFPNLFRDRATSFLLFKAVAQGGSFAAAFFSLFLFLSRSEAAHVEHVRWFLNLKNRSSRYF